VFEDVIADEPLDLSYGDGLVELVARALVLTRMGTDPSIMPGGLDLSTVSAARDAHWMRPGRRDVDVGETARGQAVARHGRPRGVVARVAGRA
jgi:hypothetical protein